MSGADGTDYATRGGRLRYLLLCAISLVFVAGGVWMILTGADSGWFVVAFFGGCAAIGLTLLLPGSGVPRVDSAGTGEPVTLRPRLWRELVFALSTSAFAAGGVWMVSEGERWGWFVLVVFGVFAAIFVIKLLPGSSYLKVGESSVEVRSLFRSHFVSYGDVESFFPISMFGNAMVGVAYAAEYEDQKTGRRFAESFSGFEGALETHGYDAGELAELLEQRRRAFGDRRKRQHYATSIETGG